jgi:hypothetical protein
MRTLLGLFLVIALGLTAMAAAPVAAASKYNDCTVVRTVEGRTCLTDRDLRLYDRWDDLTDRETRSMVQCGCLSAPEQRYLDRVLEGPDRSLAPRVIRFMAARDCFADSDPWSLRRAATRLDRDDLRSMVRLGGMCDRDLGRRVGRLGWFDILQDLWRSDDQRCISHPDLRRIDRRASDLDIWDIRAILRYDDRRGCVSTDDFRRLARRTQDLDLIDILDLFGGYDLL